MTQFVFGTGNIAAAPVGGGVPAIFGTITGASVDIDGDVKMLYGQNQYPDDVAVGKRKITGKITFGRVDLSVFNSVYFNQSAGVLTGEVLEALNESHSVPASSPYTVSSTNAATWDSDMGVYYASSGLPLTQVASAPAVGQYTVAAGIYTFAAADAGKALLLNYAYLSSATGVNLAVNQSLMGTLATFQLTLINNYKTKSFGLRLFSCVAPKLAMPIKQDDFLINELDFSAYANAAGNVMTFWTG